MRRKTFQSGSERIGELLHGGHRLGASKIEGPSLVGMQVKIPLCLHWFFLPVLTLAAEEPQEVHLWKPSVAGAKHEVTYHFNIKSDFDLDFGNGEKKHGTEELDGRFEGLLTDVRISSKGKTLESVLKVSKSQFTKDGAPNPVLFAGDEIHVTYVQSHSKVELNGKSPPPETAQLLEQLFPMSGDDVPTIEESFGPKTKIQPGGHWDFDEKAIVKYLSGPEMQNFAPGSASGHATFLGTEVFCDKPVDSLSVEFQAIALDVNYPGLPAKWSTPKVIFKVTSRHLNEPEQNAHTWSIGKFLIESNVIAEIKGPVAADVASERASGSLSTRTIREMEYRPAK